MDKKKLTVVQKYEAVMAMLKGERPEVELSVEEAIAFIGERKAQTEKKNASGSKAERKPTAEQLANEGVKEQILSALADVEMPGMTATDIGKAIGVDSNHKISALLTQLKKNDKVVRTEVKGRAYFALPAEM